MHAGRQLGQEMARAVIGNGMRRVEPEPVNVIFVHPVARILDEERPHHVAVLAVEVDRRAPRRVVPVRDVVRTERHCIRAVRTEMVVDDVEEYGEAEPVRGVHEMTQVVRRAVAARRREQGHAVVAPVARPGKIGDRHQLNRGCPKLGDRAEPSRDARERPFGTERADVQLVEDDVGQLTTGPAHIGPGERIRIDDLRGAVHAVWLPSRRRIRQRGAAVEAIPVAIAGRRL